MNNRRRTTIAISMILGATILAGSIGLGIGVAQNTANAVPELNMEKSIQLAMENNSEIKQAKIKVQKAEMGVEKAKDNRSAAYNASGGKDSINYGMTVKYDPVKAEGALTIAKKTVETTEKSVTLKVQQSYYNVLLKSRLLEVKKATLLRAQDQLRLAQANFKAGKIAQVDVTGAEAGLAQAQADVISYQNQYQAEVMTFDKLVGLDVDTVPKLTVKLTYVPLNKIDVNKSVYDAVQDSLLMVTKREDKAANDVLLQVQKSYYGPGVYSYEEQSLDNQSSDLDLKDGEIATRIAVKQAYLNLRSSEEKIKVLGKVLQKQREAVRIAALKYKVGLATNADLQDANVSLDNSEEEYASAVYAYDIAKAQFENGLFTTN